MQPNYVLCLVSHKTEINETVSYVGLGLLPNSFWLMVVDPKA